MKNCYSSDHIKDEVQTNGTGQGGDDQKPLCFKMTHVSEPSIRTKFCQITCCSAAVAQKSNAESNGQVILPRALLEACSRGS